MSKSIEKVRKDNVNNIIIAFSPEIVDEGSAFELDVDEIVPSDTYSSGLGRFEANLYKVVHNQEEEIYPSNDNTLLDEIFELDGNGDLIPKN